MDSTLYSLSSLIAPHVSQVRETKAYLMQGTCAFCAQNKTGYNAVEIFHELKLFTRYGDMELYGDVVCFDCFKVFRIQKIRSKHWLATVKEWRLLQREDILKILLNPPNGIWALYITESHKKHGWIRGMYAINYGKDQIQLIHKEFVLQTNLKEIKKVSSLIQELLDAGYTKSQLRGKWSATSLNKLMDSSLYSNYLELDPYFNSNLFYILIYIAVQKPKNSKKKEKP